MSHFFKYLVQRYVYLLCLDPARNGSYFSCLPNSVLTRREVAEAVSLIAEQKKTWRIRSHLSGNHPNVSSGDDHDYLTVTRKASQLTSHSSGGDSHEGTTENRKANAGMVTHS